MHYDELIGNVEEHEAKKYLMVDDYMRDILLDKIKKIIGIKKFDNTKTLIGTDDKLPDDITLKNVILITCVIKGNGKFHLQIFLEETSLLNKHGIQQDRGISASQKMRNKE